MIYPIYVLFYSKNLLEFKLPTATDDGGNVDGDHDADELKFFEQSQSKRTLEYSPVLLAAVVKGFFSLKSRHQPFPGLGSLAKKNNIQNF